MVFCNARDETSSRILDRRSRPDTVMQVCVEKSANDTSSITSIAASDRPSKINAVDEKPKWALHLTKKTHSTADCSSSALTGAALDEECKARRSRREHRNIKDRISRDSSEELRQKHRQGPDQSHPLVQTVVQTLQSLCPSARARALVWEVLTLIDKGVVLAVAKAIDGSSHGESSYQKRSWLQHLLHNGYFDVVQPVSLDYVVEMAKRITT